MNHLLRCIQKIIPVTADQYQLLLNGELEDILVGSRRREHFTQAQNVMARAVRANAMSSGTS